jgi:hypothetical protein
MIYGHSGARMADCLAAYFPMDGYHPPSAQLGGSVATTVMPPRRIPAIVVAHG